MSITGMRGVQYCGALALVAGVLTYALFLTAFGANYWLYYAKGTFPQLQSFSVSIGLWRSLACSGDTCGYIQGTFAFDNVLITRDWDAVKALMCVTLVLGAVSIGVTSAMFMEPRLYCVACVCVLWIVTVYVSGLIVSYRIGIFNLLSTIVFRVNFLKHTAQYGWCHWLAVACGIIFLIIGIGVSVFTCSYDWLHERGPRRDAFRAGSDVNTMRSHVSYITGARNGPDSTFRS